MAKATRVYSTPPTNTSATRRAFINTTAALPIAAAALAAAAQTLDAELIELGARFEPLVDQYYAAQRALVWFVGARPANRSRNRKRHTNTNGPKL
jgi:hypothetical protein